MTKPMSWGPSRSGYLEVVRGANLVQEDAFKCKANTGNDSGVENFNEGEWATIDADGYACKSTDLADGETLAYPVITGYERSDVAGSKSTTLALGNGYWIETSGYDTSAPDSFTLGVMCTVKLGKLVPAATGDVVRAIVKRGVSSRQTMAQKALQKTAFSTILVEVTSPFYLK